MRLLLLLMKNILTSLLLLISISFFAQVQRPKLVVGIVVDQMKMEYLYRFQNDFSENGFKRLMNEGYTFHNMHYNYSPTYTAPGHASVYTGTTPSNHGIVGNEWFNRSLGKYMYCTDDVSVSVLGNGTVEEGQMSPKNLLTTTMTDEVKLATNFKGKVIGISMKDRGSILPAGHFADWAFWYSNSGSFISSTFYGDKLPKWVDDFNAKKGFEKYINQGWNLLKPASNYDESLPDDNPYEGRLYNVEKPAFPYDLKAIYEKSNAGLLRSVPFGNDYVADFSKIAIEKEALGQDEFVDFLAISFSSTDYVGHLLGPRSMELQDTYLRLDLNIADLLKYLDKTVGKDNYLVFLTADHACAENAQFMKDHKYDVTNLDYRLLQTTLKKFTVDTFGEDLILNYSNSNVYLDTEKIKTLKLDINEVKKKLIDYLMAQPQVKRVYTEEEVLTSSGGDYFLTFIANGYDVKQNGDLVVLNKPGYLEYGTTGSTHGSVYTYDTNVPLLFFGWKIKHGETHDKKVITQIAPTVAQKLKITLPSGTESEVLLEVLE